ncbi:protein argonaute-2-like [Cloeon dipterum]|uniref:protein argonaute-2-like n=1 Tax=Cloeon dipterum TaxID=197152 RepID=UPI0032207D4E
MVLGQLMQLRDSGNVDNSQEYIMEMIQAYSQLISQATKKVELTGFISFCRKPNTSRNTTTILEAILQKAAGLEHLDLRYNSIKFLLRCPALKNNSIEAILRMENLKMIQFWVVKFEHVKHAICTWHELEGAHNSILKFDNIDSLALYLRPNDSTLNSFLEAYGANLHTLVIEAEYSYYIMDMPYINFSFERIFDACPKLQKLELHRVHILDDKKPLKSFAQLRELHWYPKYDLRHFCDLSNILAAPNLHKFTFPADRYKISTESLRKLTSLVHCRVDEMKDKYKSILHFSSIECLILDDLQSIPMLDRYIVAYGANLHTLIIGGHLEPEKTMDGQSRGQQQQRNDAQEYPPIAQLRVNDRSVQARGMGPPRPSFTQAAAPPTLRASQSATPWASHSQSLMPRPSFTQAAASPTPRASLSPTPVGLPPSQPPMPSGPPTSPSPMPDGTSSRVENSALLINLYDVDMKLISERDGSLKECPKKYLKLGIQAFGHQVWPGRYPAYDGSKLLFSCNKLIEKPVTADVNVRNEERSDDSGQAVTAKLRITVKEVQTVCLTEIGQFFNKKDTARFPHLAIQAIDVVLRNSGMTSLFQVNRSFYNLSSESKIDLGGGMDLLHGVFQSATLGDNMLLLNVDVAHKGFPRAQSVRDLVVNLGRKTWKQQQPDQWQLYNPEREYQYNGSENSRKLDERLRNYLKGLKVEYKIPQLAGSKRVYRVNDVVEIPGNLKFCLESPNEQRRQITVAAYFHEIRGYQIQHPNWPCLHVGNKDKKIFLPMELCKVVSNQVSKKLNEVQKGKMVKVAVKEPKDRKKNITEAFNSLKLMNDPCLREFDIVVEPQMTKVKDGRVLPAPTLSYGAGLVKVTNGEWKMGNQKFQLVTKEVQKWAIINLCMCATEKSIGYLKEKLVLIGKRVGVTFNNDPNILKSREGLRSAYELRKFLERQVSKGPFDLLVVFIPDPDSIGGKDPHAVVKYVLEMQNKILTQCIKYTTLMKVVKKERNSESIVPNILLKINTKLDGKNHVILEGMRPSCFKENVMFMGADVTHPPPDNTSIPSVAAVTASHDKEVFKFSMQWRLQPPGTEIILDMKDVVLKHLKFYAEKNGGTYPSRIIYYRDGVGDSQFETVLRAELSAIQRAVEMVGLKPNITFLVVQKRHHTRFFPNCEERNSMADKNGNVPAGFVVDTTITHPRDMDFYLVSHQSILGTSRPTKYKMLYDDANMNEDEVQQLTFYLCHLYARCNRSVSYPAPTYYAHHAATRAKEYYTELTINVNDENALKRESVKLNDLMSSFTVKHPMFFM